MIKINKIYTRTGDSGKTRLGDGSVTPKHSIRVEAYGNIDEANSSIGLAISIMVNSSSQNTEIINLLTKVQSDLFDIGADLCKPISQTNNDEKRIQISEKKLVDIENKIDNLNKNLKPLNSFILPGGNSTSAHLHLARTIVRRAERSITYLAEKESINPFIIKYINRLSDLLFVIARVLNNNGKGDILWKPETN